MTFAKGVYVQDIDGNQTIDAIFLVQSKSTGTTRKGDPFFKLTLTDRTGALESRVWSSAPAIGVDFHQGDFVKVQARSDVWQGQVQLNVLEVERVPADAVSLDDYLPATRFDIDELESQLRALIETHVRSPIVRHFLYNVLDDPVIGKKMRLAPAATFNHHNFIGGLLEHVVSMARLALNISWHYARYYPGAVDGDLLLAGVILHDLGKITELSYEREFSYTEEGNLLGHLVTGVRLVERVAETVPDFPPDLCLKLQHMVVSHHGKLEFGSPKKPALIEAILLHEIDVIDSRMNAYAQLLKRYERQEDPEQPSANVSISGEFTDYNKMFEGRMMIPPPAGYIWAAPVDICEDELLGPGLCERDLVGHARLEGTKTSSSALAAEANNNQLSLLD